MTFIPRLSRRSFVRAAVLLHRASVEVMRPTCFHLKHRLYLQQENMVPFVFSSSINLVVFHNNSEKHGNIYENPKMMSPIRAT